MVFQATQLPATRFVRWPPTPPTPRLARQKKMYLTISSKESILAAEIGLGMLRVLESQFMSDLLFGS